MSLASFLTIAIIILAILIVIYVFLKYHKGGLSAQDQKMVVQKWMEHVEHERDIKKAILEGDKILDFTLKKLKYTGPLGGKLKKSKSLFSNLNGVWIAHKLRNRIAHEIGVRIHPFEGKQALGYFKKALRDLGIRF